MALCRRTHLPTHCMSTRTGAAYCDGFRPTKPNARPLAHLSAYLSQSSTRYVSTHRRRRLLMVPLFDMANHARECPHHISGYEQGDWFHLIAGEDLEAGDEVCAVCAGILWQEGGRRAGDGARGTGAWGPVPPWAVREAVGRV